MSCPRVVIAGGGVAGLETVLALQALAGERVTPVLLAPARHFVHRAGAVVEPFAPGAVLRIPLAAIGRDLGVAVHRDGLARVLAGDHAVETLGGSRHGYDALVVATGARPAEALPGALTFRGPEDAGRVREVVHRARHRRARELAFVVPRGITWALPLYELALQTALAVGGAAHVTLITPELSPLAVFGAPASDAVAGLLARRGVRTVTGTAVEAVTESVVVTDTGDLPADAVIALPRLVGPEMAGLPSDPLGFVPVDDRGRVRDRDDVFAVGDIAAAGAKQGGLAAQRARVAAEAIAAAALGRPAPEPRPPVLRGALVTGAETLYLRHQRGGASEASYDPLWWPPAKIAARHLSHYLASHLELAAQHVAGAPQSPADEYGTGPSTRPMRPAPAPL